MGFTRPPPPSISPMGTQCYGGGDQERIYCRRFCTTGLQVLPERPENGSDSTGNVEEAVAALIKMHNYQLSDSSHLRVSFSKSTIKTKQKKKKKNTTKKKKKKKKKK